MSPASSGPSTDDPFAARALPVDNPDELAGVVDLFGALARDELTRALVELAYRRRGGVDETAVGTVADAAVAWAVERYYLVEYDPAATSDSDGPDVAVDGTRLTVGPVAFPTLPAEAEDLPHILEYPMRSVPRAALSRTVETRLRGDAARAVAAGDVDRMRHLLDVTYDLEAWAPVDVGEVRSRLDDALAESGADRASE